MFKKLNQINYKVLFNSLKLNVLESGNYYTLITLILLGFIVLENTWAEVGIYILAIGLILIKLRYDETKIYREKLKLEAIKQLMKNVEGFDLVNFEALNELVLIEKNEEDYEVKYKKKLDVVYNKKAIIKIAEALKAVEEVIGINRMLEEARKHFEGHKGNNEDDVDLDKVFGSVFKR